MFRLAQPTRHKGQLVAQEGHCSIYRENGPKGEALVRVEVNGVPIISMSVSTAQDVTLALHKAYGRRYV